MTSFVNAVLANKLFGLSLWATYIASKFCYSNGNMCDQLQDQVGLFRDLCIM
jgi:hypothetical protein